MRSLLVGPVNLPTCGVTVNTYLAFSSSPAKEAIEPAVDLIKRAAAGRLTGVAITVNFVRVLGAAQVSAAVPGLELSVSASDRTEMLEMLIRESDRTC